MKLFFKYLYAKRGAILVFLLCTAVFIAAFLLYRVPAEIVLYPAAVCAAVVLAALAVGFMRERRRHLMLSRLTGNVSLSAGHLPSPDGIIEEDYSALVKMICDETEKLREHDAASLRETVEYYTVWAHQIKTPIAAMKLTLDSEDTPTSRKLSTDLFRISQYVDMVMAYLRLDSSDTDYVFRECPLDSVIRQTVRAFAPEFIDRRLTLDYEPTDAVAVTDEKWLSFVLSQLISNALKYTHEGGITVRADARYVTVSDTGIGISPSDLPRIFEKGFTGETGRADKTASGIGLYLCKKICDRLGIKLSFSSVPGEGTTVTLDLGEESGRPE